MTSANLIGLAGYAGSGKDTVGRYLAKHGYGGRVVVCMAFADSMREVVRWFRGDISRLRQTDPEGYRADMQWVGERMRRVWPDIWVAGLHRRYDAARRSAKRPVVVVTDLRHQNELDWLRNQGGILVWVHNPDKGKLNEHPSEQHYYYLRNQADCIIVNSGSLEELEDAVVRFGNGRFVEGTVEDPLPGSSRSEQ